MSSARKKPSSVFRKAALDHLASPDRLDKASALTPPLAWMALLALTFLMASIIAWSLLGRLSTRVIGQGILMASSELKIVTAPGRGELMSLTATPGLLVHAGEAIGQLKLRRLEADLDEAQHRLALMVAHHAQEQAMADEASSVERTHAEQQRRRLRERRTTLRRQHKRLSAHIAAQEALLKQGLVSQDQLLKAWAELEGIEKELGANRQAIADLEDKILERAHARTREVLRREADIAATRAHVARLRTQLEDESPIVAPVDGVIVETLVGRGARVTQGVPLLTIEPTGGTGSPLEAMVYVPLENGKDVVRGQSVRISPVSFKREEFGFIYGRVEEVSAFPATRQGMVNVLANPEFVDGLMAGGAVVAVRASLEAALEGAPGYRWSSGDGPGVRLSSGTLCTVDIVVREQAPISLVLPLLKDRLGIY